VLGDLYEFNTVVLYTYNTALNNLIWGKSPGNLEMRAKTADQPGKVYKTVHSMTKRHSQGGPVACTGIFKTHKMHCMAL
jgi:hypothetical protein